MRGKSNMVYGVGDIHRCLPEAEDGGYGPDPPKIKSEKPVDNF
jgi:hypothetical protein